MWDTMGMMLYTFIQLFWEMIIDVCVAYDIVDHLKLINMRIKMEDLSVRLRTRQGFILKSKLKLSQLVLDQLTVQKSKIWKKPVNVLNEINLWNLKQTNFSKSLKGQYLREDQIMVCIISYPNQDQDV